MVELNWTLLFTFVNFGLLYLLLRLLLFKPVQNLLASRQRQIEEAFAVADANRKAAEQTRAEYEGKLAEIMSQTQQALDNVKAEGQRLKKEILERAEQEAAELRSRTEAEINHWKQRAFTALREQIADLALETAARGIASAKTPTIRREQIEAFLVGIEDEKQVNP